jgi:hypothetical protein
MTNISIKRNETNNYFSLQVIEHKNNDENSDSDLVTKPPTDTTNKL